MKNLYILLLSVVFLFTACNHHSKTASSGIKVVNKPVIKHAVNADTALVCADYEGAGDYYADNGPTLKEYEHKRKGYFNGKIKLSEDYVLEHLFDEIGSVSDTTVWNNESSAETSNDMSNAEFYLIKTLATTSKYNGVIYEKLTDEESTKYFLTIDKKGRFISRTLLAWYGPLGTYIDNDGAKHPYYTSISGCISKDGTIQLQDDRDQGRITNDNSTYKIQPDGKITRVVYFNDKDPSRNEYYESLFKVDPNNVKAHLQYADMLIHEIKGIEAKKHFEKALHLDPNFAETYDIYAFALYQSLSDTLKARLYYEKAIQLAPKTPQYRLDYAKFLCSLKDTLNAKNQYRTAVELAPNNANVHYNYGYFLINYTTNKKEARKQYLEAVKIDSNYKSQASSFGFHSK